MGTLCGILFCAHLMDNESTISGRVGKHSTDQTLQLSEAGIGHLSVLTSHGEGSHTLSIQPHVLGIRLGKHEGDTLREEGKRGEGKRESEQRNKEWKEIKK